MVEVTGKVEKVNYKRSWKRREFSFFLLTENGAACMSPKVFFLIKRCEPHYTLLSQTQSEIEG